MNILNIPVDKRPREKAIYLGINTLSDYEVLALILNTGIKGKNAIELATELINNNDGIEGLSKLNFQQLSETLGLGITKALKIVAVFELNKRMQIEKEFKLHGNPKSPKEFFNEYKDLILADGNEKIYIFAVNSIFKVINLIFIDGSDKNISFNKTEILSFALKNKAYGIVIMHGHPNGICEPSEIDLNFNDKIKKDLIYFNIKLLDNIIVTKDGYFSFLEEKLL